MNSTGLKFKNSFSQKTPRLALASVATERDLNQGRWVHDRRSKPLGRGGGGTGSENIVEEGDEHEVEEGDREVVAQKD